jgi:putative DNA primase/helicase
MLHRGCAVREVRRPRENLASDELPRQIAENYLARGQWRLPVLLGVITAPTLRPDGSILNDPRYDAATGLLFDPRGVWFPRISEAPTRDQAVAALELIKQPIALFNFVTEADRSVALSNIISAIIRRGLSFVPMHGFSAPVAGSGKSLQVDIAAEIATGSPAAVTAAGADLEELDKRIAAALLGVIK